MYITGTLTDNFEKEEQISLISNFSMPVYTYLVGVPLACSELLQPYLPAGHKKKIKHNFFASHSYPQVQNKKLNSQAKSLQLSRESHFLKTLLRLFLI